MAAPAFLSPGGRNLSYRRSDRLPTPKSTAVCLAVDGILADKCLCDHDGKENEAV